MTPDQERLEITKAVTLAVVTELVSTTLYIADQPQVQSMTGPEALKYLAQLWQKAAEKSTL